MKVKDNSLMATADALYPDPVENELQELADKMNMSERLVDMNQVIELTTLSRRTLLNLEARGEFPVRVQVTEGRKAWYLKWSTKTGHRVRVFPVSIFRFVWG